MGFLLAGRLQVSFDPIHCNPYAETPKGLYNYHIPYSLSLIDLQFLRQKVLLAFNPIVLSPHPFKQMWPLDQNLGLLPLRSIFTSNAATQIISNPITKTQYIVFSVKIWS